MAIIEVTATVKYTYNTDDGLVASTYDAIQDVSDLINSGDISSNDFLITVATA